MRLLQAMLSPKGYRKVQETMGSDQALFEQGQRFESGISAYTIGVFGTPSAKEPWMVQFGGHHLGLNVTIMGERGTLAPTLTGAQPAVYRDKEGRTVRALAAENDKAFALLDALDAAQRKAAILDYEVRDLMLGPGGDGRTIVPEGLKGSAMTARQKAMLLDLISEWAGIVNDAYAKPHLAEIRAGLDDTQFAWSGPTTHEPGRNGSSYYRIQGPRVVVEFSPQGVGGDPTDHVHTVYRDPRERVRTGVPQAVRRAACAVLLVLASMAGAHRLDEYLQLTTFSVSRGHVRATMFLNPGVAVFDRVFAAMDANGDGLLSPSEQRAYAERVLGDLSLSVDGVRPPLRLLSYKFPDVARMKEGTGFVQIEFDAKASGGRGGHRLAFENRHQSRIAAYMVECLVPSDPGLRVIAQSRNVVQSRYELRYAQTGSRASSLSQ